MPDLAHRQPNGARQLTPRYVAALGTIALVTLVGQLVVQRALSRQATDSRVINIAGRQRMLSQQLTKLAHTLDHNITESQRRRRVQEFREALALFERSQTGLRLGDPALGLPAATSADSAAMLKEIEPVYTEIVSIGHRLLDTNDYAEQQALAVILLQREGEFLAGMNSIVFALDDEAAGRVARVRNLGLGLTGVIFLVLLVEAGLVFRPVVAHVQRTIAELTATEDKLRESQHTLEIRVEERTAELRAAVEERALLAAAIEQASEMIMITDDAGIIEYVNPAFERITGYARAEAVGQTPRLLKSGNSSPEYYQQLWETITRGEVWEGHFRNRRKDGTEYEEDSVVFPVRDDQDRITHFVSVKRDVTEEVRMEAQLRQAQKMEAIGTLASGIAHDFNNILTPILGHTELALMDLPPESPLHDSLTQVFEASTRARDVIAQILTFSRKTHNEPGPLILPKLITDMQPFLTAALPATIRIETDLGAEIDLVHADPTGLHQVLLNLCTNASHAMPDGGTLFISIANVTLDAAFCGAHEHLSPGPFVRLSARDSGTGMPPEVVEHVFDPYFTTKDEGEGSGIGLAVVHGIIHAAGGDVTVESVVGEGTAFHVYLPALPPDSAAVAGAAEPGFVQQNVVTGGTEAILVVDDEPAIRDMMQRALADRGYAVTAAALGRDALALLRAEPKRFDLIVTDFTMPEMTGLELARQVRALELDVPIVMCSGFADATLTTATQQEAGIRELLDKPISPTALARVIRRVLDTPNSGRPFAERPAVQHPGSLRGPVSTPGSAA